MGSEAAAENLVDALLRLQTVIKRRGMEPQSVYRLMSVAVHYGEISPEEMFRLSGEWNTRDRYAQDAARARLNLPEPTQALVEDLLRFRDALNLTELETTSAPVLLHRAYEARTATRAEYATLSGEWAALDPAAKRLVRARVGLGI